MEKAGLNWTEVLYTHRLILLSILIRKVSFCSQWWLLQRPTAGQHTRKSKTPRPGHYCGREERMGEQKAANFNSKTFSGHCKAIAHTNSKKLWLHIQDLHKIKLDKSPSWIGEGIVKSHPIWGDIGKWCLWSRQTQSSEIQLREAIILDGLTLMLIQATVNGLHGSFWKEYMKLGDKGGRVEETEEKE